MTDPIDTWARLVSDSVLRRQQMPGRRAWERAAWRPDAIDIDRTVRERLVAIVQVAEALDDAAHAEDAVLSGAIVRVSGLRQALIAFRAALVEAGCGE